MLAVMGLLPWTATVTADEHCGSASVDLLDARAARAPRLIGRDMAMIFQEPMSSLNPCFTVGFQIAEALKAHRVASGARARAASSCSTRSASPIRRGALAPSPPALGRHEPARDDRHGARLQAEAADRRRADDRARRHHPGADPRPAAALKNETGMGAHPHHP